jgi:hypothetical protein
MDDMTTDDGLAGDHEPRVALPLTRRQAFTAGAVGVTALALSPQTAGAATTKLSVAHYNRTVIVSAPKEVVFDLDRVQAIQEDILGQLGCRACCSGFDFHFPDELEYVVPAAGELAQDVSPQDIVDAVGDTK